MKMVCFLEMKKFCKRRKSSSTLASVKRKTAKVEDTINNLYELFSIE